MHYLLDTNICIYIINRQPELVIKHLSTIPYGNIFIPSITVFELRYGAAKSQFTQKNNRAIDGFLSPMKIIDFDQNAAAYSAKWRAKLEKIGMTIGAYDLMIAGVAIANKMTLVTNNIREFSRITQLSLENWVK